MTLRRFAAWTPTAHTGAVLALVAALGVGVTTANPEAVVADRFAAALEAAPAQTSGSQANSALVSGSEAYWLAEKRRHETDGAALEPAAWTTPLAAARVSVGDRITVPGDTVSGNKAQRVLEVVAIADVVPAPGATTASDHEASAQIAVTCRDLTSADGKLVTFLAPAAGQVSAAGKPARVL
jgi:hypothetical protein